MTTLSSHPALPSAHPSYALIAPFLKDDGVDSASSSAEPTGAALFQTFNDLAHSARWSHLEPVRLQSSSSANVVVGARSRRRLPPALVGCKQGDKRASIVIPLRFNDRLSPSLLRALFVAAQTSLPDPYPFTVPPHGPTLVRRQSSRLDSDATPDKQAQAERGEGPTVYARVPLATDTLTIAVLGPDGTVVYYNLTEGIRKPIN